MKYLNDILKETEFTRIMGEPNRAVGEICLDSRDVSKDSLFVAVKGINTDGHDFINNAISNGAKCIVCEKIPKETTEDVTYVKVEKSSYALAKIASNFYDNPSAKLKLVGVTGTNGKTTIASLLYRLFTSFGYKCGLISTVNYKVGNEEFASSYTTPDAININLLLDKMVKSECDYCFMEVSSHAISQDRVTGLQFKGGIFTNLTQDHLDYHKTFKDYLLTKKRFFDKLPDNAFALTNADDKNGWVMLQNTRASKASYSLHSMADYRAKIINNDFSGLALNILGVEAWFKLVGKFNAYNILAVYATACILGESPEEVLTAMTNLESVSGRFQQFAGPKNINAIVDYAHTPDALENILKTLVEINHDKNSNIITVFGCGGNRDKSKREIMGKIVAKYSNHIIVTNDNPRFENPEEIVNDILKGFNSEGIAKSIVILDRKEAIKTACKIAKEEDIILVAGKGHEKYQEINGEKYHFDDSEVIMECFGLSKEKYINNI